MSLDAISLRCDFLRALDWRYYSTVFWLFYVGVYGACVDHLPSYHSFLFIVLSGDSRAYFLVVMRTV